MYFDDAKGICEQLNIVDGEMVRIYQKGLNNTRIQICQFTPHLKSIFGQDSSLILYLSSIPPSFAMLFRIMKVSPTRLTLLFQCVPFA